jgi:hypothetical protein
VSGLQLAKADETKEVAMRQRLTWLVLFSAVIVVTALFYAGNVWQTGGSTGWHSHSGHSLIIVTQGSVMDYESDDPKCKPHVYTQGMSLVDSGGSHVHIDAAVS